MIIPTTFYRYIISTALLTGSFFTVAQEFSWRTITGRITVKDVPLVGETILILGTPYGTITDINGEFCLIVPENETVFISANQCFEEVVREIDAKTANLHIKLGKQNKRVSKKALTRWQSSKQTLTQKYLRVYGLVDYQKELKKTCREEQDSFD